MDLLITSLGMICSVGHDVATACASVRAGLSRPKPIPHFSILDPETQEPISLNGYPLAGFAEGFNIVGFWIRVGLAALEDLIAYGHLPGPTDVAFWSNTGLIATTPPVNDARFESDDSITPDFMKKAYLNRLLQVFPYPLRAANLDIVCVGHGGAIRAIERAQAMISERGMERVIVLAVDSYLDPMTLEWLAVRDRLKTAENPVGLIPGEAGACFLVETRTSAQRRQGRAVASVAMPGLSLEPNHFFSGNLSQGEGLEAAARGALSSAASRQPFEGLIFSDCNGEEWRAYELGCARVRLSSDVGPAATFMFPCMSLGDVGAASGAVAVCLAARSLERGYAGYDRVLVLSSSDYGHIAAVCVSQVEPRSVRQSVA
jgi:3-oxoacyl-[acyl-carrier-protein] synthase-1